MSRILKGTLGQVGVLAAASLAMAGGASAAPLVNLNGLAYVQYGDGQSYSLPINGLNVQSSPGQVQDLIVVATGNKETNFTGMDNAYQTPNSGSPSFRTSTGTNDGSQGTINFNGANTWDSSLAALKTFLGSDQMVVFINNNQVNSGASTNQNLAAWAQLSITNAAGAVIGIYDFTNQGGAYKVFSEGGGGTNMGNVGSYTSTGAGPVAGTNASTDYVLSGGQICASAGVPVPCSQAHDQEFNHNLGANDAAYGVLFPELNAQLSSLFGSLSASDLNLYTFHMDLRLGCDPATANQAVNCVARDLNNGFETIFIGTAAALGVPPQLPEPGSLALAGLALLAGCAAAPRLRRRRDQA